MANRKLSVAIVGAGIGGLTAAAALRRVGIEVQVYEQASKFARIGAGIQQAPNAVNVLREIGLEPHLRSVAFQPERACNREWDSGKLTNEYRMERHVEERFGAPYLLMHRGDVHAAIASTVPDDIVHLNRKLVGLEQTALGVTLIFEGGNRAQADAVIAADGVHSVVREIILGAERPRFTGRVAYRTTFPASRLGDLKLDDICKWWGPDRHIVIYYMRPRREEIYFVTSTPERDFEVESANILRSIEI